MLSVMDSEELSRQESARRLLQLMAERPISVGKRTWTREELYDRTSFRLPPSPPSKEARFDQGAEEPK